MQVDTKLSQLRTEMVNAGVDAMIVANTDPHNNEYVAERWCGRQWLTGMKGSNGTAVVTANWCGLWTDSRYYEITEDAIAGTEIELMRMSDIGAITVDGWLKDNLPQDSTVAFNGAETGLKQAKSWIKSFELSGFKVNAAVDPMILSGRTDQHRRKASCLLSTTSMRAKRLRTRYPPCVVRWSNPRLMLIY